MKTRLLAVLAALVVSGSARAQAPPTVIPLWAGGAPGFESRKDEPEIVENGRVRNVHNPSLTVFLPPADKANGTALIICPGGGHRFLTVESEGSQVAEYLNGLGVTCFMLKYRLPREKDSPYTLDKTLAEDGHRAIRLVRSRADEFKIDPKRLGIIGFSAGGELVSMIAYDKADGDSAATDPIERQNGRPDFQMLIYPGGLGVPETVPADAPPAFMLVSNDDDSHVKPIVALMEKYRAAKAPIEVHLLSGGGHGYGMGERSKLTAVKHWSERMGEWLGDRGLLVKGEAK